MRNKVTISLSDDELLMIDNYCSEHNLKRSDFIANSCKKVIEADEIISSTKLFDVMENISSFISDYKQNSGVK